MTQSKTENAPQGHGKVLHRYVLEVIDNNRIRNFFDIQAADHHHAKAQAEEFIRMYMSAVSSVYHQREKEGEPEVSLEPMLERLHLDPAHLVEQATATVLDPSISGMSEGQLRRIVEMADQEFGMKKSAPSKPVKESFLWQIREVQ